jgi:hypothetical protein
MDWTMEEGYDIPIGTHCHMSYPQEVSPMSFTLHLIHAAANFASFFAFRGLSINESIFWRRDW